MTTQNAAVTVLNRNIVQTEFFHVGGGRVTLDEVFEEIGTRLIDQSPIKTTVRFYDPDGSLTNLVSKLEQAEKHRRALEKAFFEAKSWWRRKLLDYRARRLVGKVMAMKRKVIRLAIKKLHTVVGHADQVALELHDHRFRHMQPNEAHELLESISNVSNMWIFVFKPNDLLADKHSAVAHAF
ncbi:MAG: hypothetical protein G01um101456_116 [Parcubacteria group bacterium Gr01-1014_56]|nr:MAG: hypothetical protein G01um101456_116 [Parcubacteria group bacterium Gr01-1014_56]